MENIILNKNDTIMYNNIQITANDTKFAQGYTCDIEDEFLRKKLFYSLSIASALKNHLNVNGFNFEMEDSLFQVPAIIENYEFVDIYIKNLPIQVAYTFENDTTVAIPKIHFEASIEPPMYIVAKLHSNLSSFDLIGTINTNFLNKVKENNKYIYVDITTLNKIDKITYDINKYTQDYEFNQNCEVFEHIKTNFISFIDNNLTIAENVELIKHLLKCPDCRNKLINYYKFESMVQNIDSDSELINKIDEYIYGTVDKYYVKESSYNLNDIQNNIVEKENISQNCEIEVKENLTNKVINFENKDENTKTSNPSNINDNIKISLLYNSNPTLNKGINTINEIDNINKTKNNFKKVIILFIIFILSSVSLCYYGYKYYKIKYLKNKQNNIKVVDNISSESANPLEEQNAKTKEVLVPRPLKLSQISWEAPENILKTPAYNKYLIDVGKNLKINLQNQFFELNEIVYQTKYQLQVLIDTNGTVADIKIIQASGNEAIDELILTTTKQTLNYIKPPVIDTIKEPLILILEFEF